MITTKPTNTPSFRISSRWRVMPYSTSTSTSQLISGIDISEGSALGAHRVQKSAYLSSLSTYEYQATGVLRPAEHRNRLSLLSCFLSFFLNLILASINIASSLFLRRVLYVFFSFTNLPAIARTADRAARSDPSNA